MTEEVKIESKCHTCGLRARAEGKPHSLFACLSWWHTSWCPGWKAYLKEMESKGLEVRRP
jgi:hypothetical protein